MNDWVIWMLAAGAMVLLEIFTGTFYLLMIGIGLFCGGVAALMGVSGATQFVVAGVAGMIATYALRRSTLGRSARAAAGSDASVNLDIGQTVIVDAWQNHGDGHTARVLYRGAEWDVELLRDAVANAGAFTIREVKGNRLLVANAANSGGSGDR